MDSFVNDEPGAEPQATEAAQAAEPVAAVTKPERGFTSPPKVLFWTLTLCASFAALAGVSLLTLDRMQTESLLQAGDSEIRSRLSGVWPNDAPGEYYEALGEFAELLEPENREMAKLAAEKAVSADPTRTFAWARLAYLSQEVGAPPAETTLNALRGSMYYCPLCDQELVRWRFNFVLSNWEHMPEDLRRHAFAHADMLRWSGSNAEFLAEMRVKAHAAEIPYDAYRAAVNTPVKSWDIALPEPEPEPISEVETEDAEG